MLRLTSSNELYSGEFGKYPPYEGYMQDYVPYNYTRTSFRKELKNLKDNEYIRIGETKALDIDYSVLYPQTSLFINVNMLIEFTHLGQLIPTRFDVAFYKLSSFSKYARSNQKITDLFRLILVLYQIYTVIINVSKYKNMSQVCSWKFIEDNYCDLMIIFLQFFCFSVKVADKDELNIDPKSFFTAKELV